ncbi:copper chaperone PCu(A)C [Streptomyces luteolus]|uniref:Copper chaperone PCu(A)C n=1 Tax=Streptomyces luteolus TaxID=3043615 RepID=A0ABT6SY13_9ACTN|nr:copper chaperone PCu(A)C [Streptomyces sp. B-S-A12]MDI3420486.1 copper chaperone PCu(A)C [Streptomyces sp. B-S-A12]
MTPRTTPATPRTTRGTRTTRTTRTTLVAAIAVASALALAGCGSSGGSEKAGSSKEQVAADAKPRLDVTGGYMPEPVTKDMAGGFLTVTNKGGADKLTSVTSDVSKSAEIHETVGQKMKKAKSFDIPANGTLKLERGGNHIMFLELKKMPKKGDKIAVELHFEKSAPVKAELEVMDPTHNPNSH